MTLSFDGKTIYSTGAMERNKNLIHIISIHVAELRITLGQQTVAGKSNEIPALRELLDMLELEGCMVVADALHCQRETAKAIVSKQADYLPSVKDNQATLKESIADYVQDDTLRKTMDTGVMVEKNRAELSEEALIPSVMWSGSKASRIGQIQPVLALSICMLQPKETCPTCGTTTFPAVR